MASSKHHKALCGAVITTGDTSELGGLPDKPRKASEVSSSIS